MSQKLLNLFSRNRAKGSLTQSDNTVYLYDFIAGSKSEADFWGGVCAEDFAAALAQIDGAAIVRIDSPGGDVFGGRAIAQAIKDHQGGVTVYIDGLAASAASYIAISADRVEMAEGAFFMVHKAWGMSIGNADDFRSIADRYDQIDDSIAETYARKAGGEKAEWLDRMKSETWLGVDDAISAGLADSVIGGGASPAQNKIQWDVSAFDNAPQPKETDDAQALIAAEEVAKRKRDMTLALLGDTK